LPQMPRSLVMRVILFVNDPATLCQLALVSHSLCSFVQQQRYSCIQVDGAAVSGKHGDHVFRVEKKQLKDNLERTLRGYESFDIGHYVERIQIKPTYASIELYFLFITAARLKLRKMKLLDNDTESKTIMSTMLTHFGHSVISVDEINSSSKNLQALLGHLSTPARHSITRLVIDAYKSDATDLCRLINSCINLQGLSVRGMSQHYYTQLNLQLTELHIDTQRGLLPTSFLFCKQTLTYLSIDQSDRFNDTIDFIKQLSCMNICNIQLPSYLNAGPMSNNIISFITVLFELLCNGSGLHTLSLSTSNSTTFKLTFKADAGLINHFMIKISGSNHLQRLVPLDHLLSHLLSSVPNLRHFHMFHRFFSKNLKPEFTFNGGRFSEMKTFITRDGQFNPID